MTQHRVLNLENLASELALLIASQIPDLVTLDSLLRASPVFFRVFEENAVNMTESVLSFGHTHRHIQFIIRSAALIRSSKVPAPNLDHFMSWATGRAMYKGFKSLKSTISPYHLAKDTTPIVLRQILATNRKITSLALDCLQFYLARFRTLKPDHPIDKNFALGGYRRTKKVQGKRFLAKEPGPPEWVEEQRVIRAFWRVQLVYDLKQSASSLPWPEDDIAALLNMHPMEMYHDHPYRVGHDDFEPHYEYHEIYSVYHYVHEAHGKDAKKASAFTSTALVHGEVCRQWPAPAPEEDSWKSLRYASRACNWHFYSYRNYGKTSVDFEWFRYWGFAFWFSRMIDAGFLPDWRIPRSGPTYGNLDNAIYLFA